MGENTNPTGLGDLHEAFDIGWEVPSSGINEAAMDGVNVWPPDIPEFKDILTDY